MVGALLRTAIPSNRHLVLDFLQGLSRDELECLAEFQGSCVLEQEFAVVCQPYRLMADFFDPSVSERWRNPDDRAHKMFIVLAYLDMLQPRTFSGAIGNGSIPIRVERPSFNNA